MTSDRRELLQHFLDSAGWGRARQDVLRADASTRSYRRLHRGADQVLLMDAPPAVESAPCPPGATPEQRAALGYNALARLAGPNLHAFIEISSLLRAAGLHAPEVYAADPKAGFALIEDFGDNLYAKHIPSNNEEQLLYSAAIDVLVHLHNTPVQQPVPASYTILDFDETALKVEANLLMEWYWPFKRAAAAPDDAGVAYAAAWREVLQELQAPQVLVLRDYHAENLLWLKNRKGLGRVGIIDFQDGLIGHRAYDLVSLLEDARRDVSPDLATQMQATYKAEMKGRQKDFDTDQFDVEYAILAAQRNAKILGIFARLVVRDGKAKYRSLLPRVERHFAEDIGRPALKPVLAWAKEHFPEASTR